MLDEYDGKIDAAVVKCTSCGADMVFDPAKGKLSCPYCESTRDIEKTVPMMRDFLYEKDAGGLYYNKTVYNCPNCGGEIELEEFATATVCPFCGATNIVKRDDIKGLKPESILPFSVTKEVAAQCGKKWVKRRIFAPYKFKKSFLAENLKGIYIPSFAFNSDSISHYFGRLGDRKTRVVGSGDKKRVETYILWYDVSGTYTQSFENIMVETSTQIKQKELEKIAPYDMNNAEGYKREYVAGFVSERYDTPLEESFKIARTKMDNTIRKGILAKYNADIVDTLNVSTDYNNVKFRYTMLPLWIGGYKYKEKLYRFIINGRTGKSTGKTPISPIRISIAVLLALGIVALLVWLFVFDGYIGN